MVSHKELARLFSEGAEKGRGSRMFIEGDTIYSYGHHFPIARRTEWGYLFNSKSYSSSTASHKSYVLGKLKGVVLEIMDCDLSNFENQIKQNNFEIDQIKDKLQRVRKEHIKEIYEEQIEWLREQNKLLKKHGGKK